MAAVGQFSASVVKSRAYPLDASQVAVVGPTLTSDAGLGDYYTVTVSYPFDLNVPLWAHKSLTLTSRASMRKE